MIPLLGVLGIVLIVILRPRDAAVSGDLNLLVITVDTCRADHIGAYGSPTAATPNIDRLAAEGMLFENCVTPVPLTLPAHTSIFTGYYPPGHKVRNNGTYRLGPDPATLAEIMKSRGYRTAAFVSSFVLLSKFGLNRGFDDYDDSLNAGNLINNFKSEIPGGVVYDKFQRWYQKEGSGKFFAWIHLYDPHVPYAPPKEFADKFPGTPQGRYDGEIAFADSIIGKVFADLKDAGVFEKTLIVVCADHGEAFGEHEEVEHGIFCYQDTLKVPLIIANPGILPKPGKIRPMVSLADVMPTLLDLLGIDAPAGVQGQSLVPLIRKGAPGEKRPFYLESMYGREEMGWAPLTGLISGNYKYISLPQPELYDLENDPDEKNNLAAAKAAVARELDGVLSGTIASLTGAGGEAKMTLSTDDRERLRALGYVSALSNKALTNMDPKLGIVVDRDIRACLDIAERGNVDEADARLKMLRDRNPGIEVPLFYDVEYVILRRRKMVKESRELMLKAASKFPQIDRFHMLSALTSMELGDFGETERSAREVLKNNPTFSSAYTVLGQVAEKKKDLAGALENYRKALELEPQNMLLKSKYADLLIANGDFAAAAAVFNEMLANGEVLRNADFLFKIAVFNNKYGTLEKAEELLRRAVSIERTGKYLFNYAMILAKGSRLREALPIMEEAVSRHSGELSAEQIQIGKTAIDAWKEALRSPGRP
jgi:arylsulfatase A-like enzyme/tetratricopeptide (TPR) repeat protein